MDLKDVLRQVPGLNRRFVSYLESQGHIRPKRLPKRRIDRRDYSEADVAVVRETWRYYSRGLSLQAAARLATTQKRRSAYVGLSAQAGTERRVIARIAEADDAVEAAVVYADDFNVMAKLLVRRDEDVYEFAASLLAEGVVDRAPRLWNAEPAFARAAPNGGPAGMMAYLLIKAPGKDVAEVLRHLEAIDEVVEAGAVYGESDIIARIEAPSQEALDRVVMEQLHEIEAVESTRTYIVVGGTRWVRE